MKRQKPKTGKKPVSPVFLSAVIGLVLVQLSLLDFLCGEHDVD
jgi:hypothetical protein